MNNVRRLIVFVLMLTGIAAAAHAGEDNHIFSVYLVRHAEKGSASADPDDPPLSACGRMRAESLAVMLRDTGLEHVYSTPYARTRMTARPIASSHRLEIETYDPHELEAFSDALLAQKKNALVVGHSNTTAVLAGLLAQNSGEAFDEDEYDRLYLVTAQGADRQMILLHQAFTCDPF